jgi:hypothetical protein
MLKKQKNNYRFHRKPHLHLKNLLIQLRPISYFDCSKTHLLKKQNAHGPHGNANFFEISTKLKLIASFYQ